MGRTDLTIRLITIDDVQYQYNYARTANRNNVDRMTIQNFGDNSTHHSDSDSIHFSGSTTPYVATRCTINKTGARGIWSQLNHQKALYSDNSVTLTRACIDADSSTFGSVMMFNFCDSNDYGLFVEQSAQHNASIGNISNNNSHN